MHFHQNHCWCSESNWNNGMFDATYMVSINKWPDYKVGTPHHLQEISPDWLAVVDEVEFMCQEEYDRNAANFARLSEQHAEFTVSEENLRKCSMRRVNQPKAEVIDWLTANVADVRDPEQPKGWCVGNQNYRYREAAGSLTFWFRRRRDAMAFIHRWSVHGKPTTYLNYFKDDYRKLRDGKLTKVTR